MKKCSCTKPFTRKRFEKLWGEKITDSLWYMLRSNYKEHQEKHATKGSK